MTKLEELRLHLETRVIQLKRDKDLYWETISKLRKLEKDLPNVTNALYKSQREWKESDFFYRAELKRENKED
tara:strand:+ start:335 stop:550 length:216 start_codon:yes stop_codon:yes gene_type:complete